MGFFHFRVIWMPLLLWRKSSCCQSTMEMSGESGFSKERLNNVVAALKAFLSDDQIRLLGQRAVQGKAWHRVPEVAAYMSELRSVEETKRGNIMSKLSALIFRFHDYTLDATLARAGLIIDGRVHPGSSLDKKTEFDLFCLDSKERLYMILKQYGWLPDFFRLYPQHFYENSFRFVDLIPPKELPITVHVVGLGIGGSLAVSGLAKNGIKCVHGFEQRARTGQGSVTSRYQNASWRAYDISEKLLDQDAFNILCKYRQRLNVTYDNGTSRVVTTDRVQIIIGNAVEAGLASAERLGATLHFGHHQKMTPDEHVTEQNTVSPHEGRADIVALFCGAHTASLSPLLEAEMKIFSWPSDVSSTCMMWLKLTESPHTDAFCTRGGELGAEKWHYTINSARDEIEDVLRVRAALMYQFKATGTSDDTLPPEYHMKLAQIDKVLRYMETSSSSLSCGSDCDGRGPTARFDYKFTNAPHNEHNRTKRTDEGKDGTVVLDGAYTVDIKLASHAVIGQTSSKNPTAHTQTLLDEFGAHLIVLGGDACVPPNPLAAYGATLACEAADMLVQLAVAHGHLNAILSGLGDACATGYVDAVWVEEVEQLKVALADYYDARSRSENYFQWVQTLICNLYSLPPFVV